MKKHFFKDYQTPIAMLTTYDAPTAKAADEAGVDILLVGDSLGPNMLGYDSVREVTLQDMVHHVKAVRRGAPEAYILADLPYNDVQSIPLALHAAETLLQAGADSLKLETEVSAMEILKALTDEGFPICAHIGYTPQTPGLAISAQGKELARANELVFLGLQCQKNGAFMIVLELIPTRLAQYITELLAIPTIGIGAGPFCKGQVQVFYDLLGYSEKLFRHAKLYAEVGVSIQKAFTTYANEVHQGLFPTKKNAAQIDNDILKAIKGKN